MNTVGSILYGCLVSLALYTVGSICCNYLAGKITTKMNYKKLQSVFWSWFAARSSIPMFRCLTACYSKHLSRITSSCDATQMSRITSDEHWLFKRCKTANLSHAWSLAQVPVLKHLGFRFATQIRYLTSLSNRTSTITCDLVESHLKMRLFRVMSSYSSTS